MTSLEKAARALAKEVQPHADWDRMNPQFRAPYFREARAVLLAVREPSDVMLLAAKGLPDADAYEAFTAMIDAILEKGDG
jgi:hypothetical protein